MAAAAATAGDIVPLQDSSSASSSHLRQALPQAKGLRSMLSSPAIRTGLGSPVSFCRSQSAPDLAKMAATLAPASSVTPAFRLPPDHTDPPPQQNTTDTPVPCYFDAGTEVTALSNKLIAAINYQTNLDDLLAAARQELDESKDTIRQLQATNKEHEELLANGTLVRRADVDQENAELRTSLEEERQRCAQIEKEKKAIEQELENLTTALFEEANQMVAAARHERDLTEKKNEQLKAQLRDTENLLASHQEQLVELKTVMQQMSSDKEDNDTNTNLSTAPTTPLLGTHEQLGKLFDALHLYPNTPGSDEISPSYPTSFSHLLQPVLRTDLPAYQDFASLLKTSRTAPARHRMSSGPYSGLSLVGLGGLRDSSWTASSPSPTAQAPLPSPASGGGSVSSAPAPPPTPTSAQSNGPTAAKDVVPLRETRFYKRVLAEDIEPTLRLDIAPGLSWLARRTVLASMSEGNLVVEPLPSAPPSLRVVACALCGERRRGDEYARVHQFRVNDSDNAQRYALCRHCTARVRATCDFLGFLRLVRDGHWRAEGDEGERSAWEESVRLRDRMFWARIGGGVVPAFMHAKDSPRSQSGERRATGATAASTTAAAAAMGATAAAVTVAAAAKNTEGAAAEGVGEGGEEGRRPSSAEQRPSLSSSSVAVDSEDDVFHSTRKRVSIGTTIIAGEEPSPMSTVALDTPSEFSAAAPGSRPTKLPATPAGKVAREEEGDMEHSPSAPDSAPCSPRTLTDVAEIQEGAQGLTPPVAPAADQRSLSLTIPGAFDDT